MKLSCITVILILFYYSGSVIAQEMNRLVKATNPRGAIKDGEEGITKYWSHLAKNKFPIVYDLAKNQAARQVTFYTDIDSISINVTSNAAYPFNVILNKKDTIAVILSTYTTSYSRLNNANNSVDSFKFSVNENKQIILKGSINNSAELDFVFDLGARMTFLIGNNLADKNHLILDGYMEDESSSGLSTEIGRAHV